MDDRELIEQLYPFSERKGLSVTPIQGDASNRRYLRVSGHGETRIACIDPAFRDASPETFPFLVVGKLLDRQGVRIPKLLAADSRLGAMLLEDCGDLMLQDEALQLDEGPLEARYRQVIDLLADIQTIPKQQGAIPFSLSFDHAKLMFEFDFFIEHALHGHFAGIIGEREVNLLRNEFEAITGLLLRPEHFVLNHRDFHSRNIMLSGNEPVVIDFQDARLGLPQYDAASLLRDSYVTLDDRLAARLREYHFGILRERGALSMSREEYLRLFDLMAFQRNIKALGTFCFQITRAGNRSFERSIAPTLRYLPGYIEARRELATAGRLLSPLIRTAKP